MIPLRREIRFEIDMRPDTRKLHDARLLQSRV